MKYKVGDKVRVRKDLKIDTNYYSESGVNSESIIEPMLQFCGEIAIVTSIFQGTYSIDIDEGDYYWTDEMFEGLVEETQLSTKQEEIPYINAEEARKMFDIYSIADDLRRIVYAEIRECAKKQKKTVVDVSDYPLAIQELIVKELEFKGFSACRIVDSIGRQNISIVW